jgi:Tfp pilus assembly protein PilF
LQEKDFSTKMDLLFKKNLFSLAISLASNQHDDTGVLVDILRRYGDHLYSKGQYDAAMAQYKQTIGRLEPSYVIRKASSVL